MESQGQNASQNSQGRRLVSSTLHPYFGVQASLPRCRYFETGRVWYTLMARKHTSRTGKQNLAVQLPSKRPLRRAAFHCTIVPCLYQRVWCLLLLYV